MRGLKYLLMVLPILFSLAASAMAKEDPSVFLKQVADKMIAQVEKQKEQLKKDISLAEKLVRTELLPIIDQEYFAKRTLGKKIWTEATEEQRKTFVKAFTDLVINTYAKGLSLYDGQKFLFDQARFSKSGKTALVKSEMKQQDGAPVAIEYKLRTDGQRWYIIDLTIEGVSMVKSYKNQFVPKVRQMGMAAFLEDLKNQKKQNAA